MKRGGDEEGDGNALEFCLRRYMIGQVTGWFLLCSLISKFEVNGSFLCCSFTEVSMPSEIRKVTM